MTANQADYSIQMMSRTLGVSRSGFYAHHSRPPSDRALADDALNKRIAQIHETSKESYGAPRIHAELADEGVHVGRKRVLPLIWWTATFMLMLQMCFGSQILLMCRHGRAFYIWQLSLMPSAAASLAGPWETAKKPNWSLMR